MVTLAPTTNIVKDALFVEDVIPRSYAPALLDSATA
jgi:hypothetical protein